MVFSQLLTCQQWFVQMLSHHHLNQESHHRLHPQQSQNLNVQYRLDINDELRQQGDTGLLIFDIAALLADISQVFSLEPGDVVMTGTPAGVAALQSGDQLKMTLQGRTQAFVWTTFVK